MFCVTYHQGKANKNSTTKKLLTLVRLAHIKAAKRISVGKYMGVE